MKKRAKKRPRSAPAKRRAPRQKTPLLFFDRSIVTDLRELLPAAEFDGLLSRAREAMPATLGELHQARKPDDREETRRQAHKLAGLAGNFGCVALMEAARRVEALCAKGSKRQLDRLVRALDDLMAPTLEALNQGPPPRAN